MRLLMYYSVTVQKYTYVYSLTTSHVIIWNSTCTYEVFISYMTVCINVDVLSRTKIYDHMQYRNIYVHVQSTCTSYKYLVYTYVVPSYI